MGDDALEPELSWYGVRCFIAFPAEDEKNFLYEERVTIWRAASAEDAIEFAEAEVVQYADGAEGVFMALSQSYAMYDDPGQGAEVYSLMRESSLPPAAYLDQFFDTGDERDTPVEG